MTIDTIIKWGSWKEKLIYFWYYLSSFSWCTYSYKTLARCDYHYCSYDQPSSIQSFKFSNSIIIPINLDFFTYYSHAHTLYIWMCGVCTPSQEPTYQIDPCALWCLLLGYVMHKKRLSLLWYYLSSYKSNYVCHFSKVCSFLPSLDIYFSL
jgi:hypothetical protein